MYSLVNIGEERRVDKMLINKLVSFYAHKLYCIDNHQYLIQSLVDIEEKSGKNLIE